MKESSMASQIANSCAHFTGVQNNECKAGVAYSSFPGRGIPCLRDFALDHVCEKRHFPTPDEVAEKIAAQDAAWERTQKALAAVYQDAKARGLGKKSGGGASVPCPVCTTGTLAYSVSGYNGHIHGRCGTEGCVWWMQ